ncbi:MAG: glycoside hydrolase family 17 [Gammaproteobacteria bacterium]|nr:glycoside hydrolase family 17 [Gammaproteobacteria bacterium]
MSTDSGPLQNGFFTSRTAAAVLLLCFGLWAVWSWWNAGTPVRVPGAASAKLPCISYAPSRQEGPARAGLTVAQLRKDLALLSQRTGCIRTYTVSEGFDQVPAVAREFGMHVLLGLWIGRDDAHNELEIARGILIAQQHRDVVRAVVVGNEVLLRHEQPPERLAAMLRRVAAATGLPVTYADVWEYWLDYKQLAQEVSFVTVHILPYWDDYPVGIDEVMPYVDHLYSRLQRELPGKQLFVGETGWPTAGRPRGPAEPGRVNQAIFLRGFAELARQRGVDFNVIEAFDQPWKVANEGTVGGHWGLYDANGRAKVGPDDSVVEARAGRAVAVSALLAGAIAALVALLVLPATRAYSATLAFGLGTTAVTVAAQQWRYLAAGNLHSIDWAVTLPIVALGWIALACVVRAALSRSGIQRHPIPRYVELPLLIGAVYVCLGLLFAGRHRDFPVWLFLPGVVAFTLVALSKPAARALALRLRSANEEVVMATCLVLTGPLVVVLEGLQNGRALGWGLSSVLLGLAVLGPLFLQAGERQRTREHANDGPGERIEHHAERTDRRSKVGEGGGLPP